MKQIFIKFRKRAKDQEYWSGYSIQNDLKDFLHRRKPRTIGDGDEAEEKEEPSHFTTVYHNFERDLFSLLEFVPRIQFLVPVLLQAELNSRIYTPIVEKGYCVKSRPLFEIYAFPVSEFGEINRRLKAFVSFDDAKQNLPRMLLISLIANYDSCPAPLLWAIFL